MSETIPGLGHAELDRLVHTPHALD